MSQKKIYEMVETFEGQRTTVDEACSGRPPAVLGVDGWQ